MGCQQVGEKLENCCAEILAAIAGVSTKVSKVQSYVTLDVEGSEVTDLVCPVDIVPEGEEAPEPTQVDYVYKGLTGIYELQRIANKNIVSNFLITCEAGGALAAPAWWQTRLGSGVPQLACTFRKAGTRTYHSLAIPHPKDTEKATRVLLPAYVKGNHMGMLICKDNSKFIINCVSEAEANRMCAVAIELIDPEWLETPPRIHLGQRKGQAVGVDDMNPTSISYYPTGQQNLVPAWRAKVSDTE